VPGPASYCIDPPVKEWKFKAHYADLLQVGKPGERRGEVTPLSVCDWLGYPRGEAREFHKS